MVFLFLSTTNMLVYKLKNHFTKLSRPTFIKMLLVVAFMLIVAASADTGSETKIHSITLSPPVPLEKGAEVVATARFFTLGPVPDRLWQVFFKTGGRKNKIPDQLRVLSKNEYESKVSLGPIHRAGWVYLQISNSYGTADKNIEFGFGVVGDECETSEQCTSPNSICDPQMKRCFCLPGFGADYDAKEDTCEKLPFHKVKSLRLEDGIDMDCKVYYPDVKEINWFRDGVHCTYGSSCSQDREIRYDEDDFYYQRRLWLLSVYANHTYTCQVTTTDGRKYTVAENEVQVGIQFDKTRRIAPGSNDTILCALRTTRYQIRLVRDGKDVCTPEAKWCEKRASSRGENDLWFDVFNLQASHTFTCEAYDEDKKQATISAYYYIIADQ